MDFDEVFSKGKEGAESISKFIFFFYVVYYGTSNEIFWDLVDSITKAL